MNREIGHTAMGREFDKFDPVRPRGVHAEVHVAPMIWYNVSAPRDKVLHPVFLAKPRRCGETT